MSVYQFVYNRKCRRRQVVWKDAMIRNDAPFQYSNSFRINENHPAIARSWLDPNLMFAQPQVPPFYQYFPHTPPPPHRIQVPNAVDNSSTCASTGYNRNSAVIPSSSAPSTSNNTCDTNGAKSAAKWVEGQISVLVSEWKDRIEEFESARATETWNNIVEEVNKSGDPKTVKQCKDKIRNLKKKYRGKGKQQQDWKTTSNKSILRLI